MIRLTLRSLRARWVRFGLTSLAVVVGVAFVTGSFVLSDTLSKTFDAIAGRAALNVDVLVRASDPLDRGDQANALRPPTPQSLVDKLAQVDGVARAEGSITFLPAVTLPAGTTVKTTGAPILGFSWQPRPDGSSGVFELTEGRGPSADHEVALDVDMAKANHLKMGDVVGVRAAGGEGQFTISGLITFGDSGGGAYYLIFAPPTAQRLSNLAGHYQSVALEAAANINEVELRDRVVAVLPEGYDAITGSEFTKEFSDSFGQIIDIIRTVLLVFAFVALFVAGFIINVVFNTTLGQRVRELSLLRAIGAGNAQVTSSVLAESSLIGLFSSLLGTVVGIGFAKLLIVIITSQGGGFPDTGLTPRPTTWLVALVVGVGVTLAVSVLPAWRAGRISPVAAMRDGATLLSNSIRTRTIVGAVATAVGALIFLGALFAPIDSTATRLSVLGFGAFLLFMGATGLSPLVTRPITEALSWPFVRIYGVTGVLARGNASRNPRRTATTASALMVGVALVSTVGVLGSSFKASFSQQLSTGISADFFLTPEAFSGFSPALSAQLAELPEIAQVITFRQGSAKIGGAVKSIQAVQSTGLDRIINLGMRAGTSAEIPADGILVQDQAAADLGLALGDPIEVQFPIGAATLTVTGLFHTNVTGSNWIIAQSVFEDHFPPDVQLDSFGGVALAEGVTQAEAAAAITAATAAYPDVKVESRAEFQKTTEEQINQTTVIVNVLLFFSLFIAMLGIVITMMLAVFERTRELGLLRAIGQQRRQTRTMVRIESTVVSLFGAVLGLGLGLLFGIAIASALPESVMSTIAVPYGQVALTFVAAGVAGVVAGILPAWRGSRLKVLDAIAYE